MGFYGILWGFMGFLWDFMGFYGILWDLIGICWRFLRIDWTFTGIDRTFTGRDWIFWQWWDVDERKIRENGGLIDKNGGGTKIIDVTMGIIMGRGIWLTELGNQPRNLGIHWVKPIQKWVSKPYRWCYIILWMEFGKFVGKWTAVHKPPGDSVKKIMG
jgi:hypothetical protein